MLFHPGSAPPDRLQLALKCCRGAFYYAALFSLCINILALLTSLYSMQVLDRVLSSRSTHTLLMLTLVMTAAIIFQNAFTTLRTLVLEHTGAWIERTLAPNLLSYTISMSASGMGGSASQQQRDLAALRQFITGIGMVTLFDAPWSLLYVLMIFAISGLLGWVTLVGCVLLVMLAVVTEYAMHGVTKQTQHVHLHHLSLADGAARQADAVEAMGMGRAMLARWRQQFERVQSLQAQSARRAALLQTITRTWRMVLQIAITGLGAYEALDNKLTAGGMIAASILAGRAFAPFDNAVTFWKQYITTRDAYQRLRHSVTMIAKPKSEMTLPPPKGIVRVEQVGYQPSPKHPVLLRQIQFSLAAGESLGIIGASGAGKSTLARLMTGITAPTHGTIRLDGNDISTWNRSDLGPSIGYVPQAAELFPGTIRDNIARMQPDADPDAVIRAAQLAHVHEMIQLLPMGYDTPWSPANPCLAPGQRQRIALARAVFGDPCLVILDEPNAHMDGEGEMALVTTLQELKLKRTTVIVVAHKPSIIACMDTILVLRHGSIEQFGPRDQILQNYARPQAKIL